MIKIGMITPSSNTIVEQATMEMTAQVNELSVHFSRFKLTEVSLARLGDFSTENLLAAADMLADAQPDVIAYNATAGVLLGSDWDQRLCSDIYSLTSIPATTTIIGLKEAFRLYGIQTFCFVSPYSEEGAQRVIDEFGNLGLSCTGSKNFDIQINRLSSEITSSQIALAIEESFMPGTDAIILYGTNMHGARVVEQLENQYDVPVLDTVAVTLWHSLLKAGMPDIQLNGWGRLLAGKY